MSYDTYTNGGSVRANYICKPMCIDNNMGGCETWLTEAETNGHHFPDDIFKCIFLNENVFIAIKISLKFVPRVKLTKFHHWFR